MDILAKQIIQHIKNNPSLNLSNIKKEYNLAIIGEPSESRVVYSRDDLDFVLKYEAEYSNTNTSQNYLEYKRSKHIQEEFFAKIIGRVGPFLFQEKLLKYESKDQLVEFFKNKYRFDYDVIGDLFFDISENKTCLDKFNSNFKRFYFACNKIYLRNYDFHSKNFGYKATRIQHPVMFDYGEGMSKKDFMRFKEIIK